ncbi:hypothetical protein EDB84DRAFT_1676050 [Lactarius hengduanensis]|nr:hypothetical protein EDB84DRAFT_1676050 [Lactarius hengduanensis]
MPPCDRALVHHLKGVVDFVKGLGRDVAVIENDDCMSPVNERQLPGLPLWDIWDICSLYWMHDICSTYLARPLVVQRKIRQNGGNRESATSFMVKCNGDGK